MLTSLINIPNDNDSTKIGQHEADKPSYTTSTTSHQNDFPGDTFHFIFQWNQGFEYIFDAKDHRPKKKNNESPGSDEE